MKTTDLFDQYGEELTLCSLTFHSFGKQKRFFGPIETVRVFEDNVLVRETLEQMNEGTVLVVDGGGSVRCALLGDQLAQIAETRKVAGIIINGCVRDTAELAALDVGILAIGKNPIRSKKEGKGERSVSLFFGDVNWTPGHYVYADEDGVLVSPRKLH